MDEKFYTERKEIGVGRWGKVYLWNGFAYKVFDKSYPIEYIEHEIQIQNEINKTAISTVKYYKTDDLHVIRMDYIDGITLAERITRESYNYAIEDLFILQKQIHGVHDVNVPNLRSVAHSLINGIPYDNKKEHALRYLYEINETENLCHLDLHTLNIMYSNRHYYIIDWFAASIGNPIFDYARTYILLFLSDYDNSQKYINLLKQDDSINLSDFDKALYIAALSAKDESNCERLQQFFE